MPDGLENGLEMSDTFDVFSQELGVLVLIVDPFFKSVECVERDRIVLIPGHVYAVLSAGLLMDDVAQSLVGVAEVNDHDLLSGIV